MYTDEETNALRFAVKMKIVCFNIVVYTFETKDISIFNLYKILRIKHLANNAIISLHLHNLALRG